MNPHVRIAGLSDILGIVTLFNEVRDWADSRGYEQSIDSLSTEWSGGKSPFPIVHIDFDIVGNKQAIVGILSLFGMLYPIPFVVPRLRVIE